MSGRHRDTAAGTNRAAVSDASRDELLRSVLARTHRQVRNLDIDCAGDLVTVTGDSRSYYVKQLATQAIFDVRPRARLCNEIVVC